MLKKWYNTTDPKTIDVLYIDNTEFMMWLYCPIKTPCSEIIVPDNLSTWLPIVDVLESKGLLDGKYVYLTVKSGIITPSCTMQRDGWHSDGFLSSDKNYIWSDCNTTLFSYLNVELSLNHEESLIEMEKLNTQLLELSYKSCPNTLYALTENHIHKPDTPEDVMFRNFVKVSVSDHVYTHNGMSRNYDLPINNGGKKIKTNIRNCPI